MRPYFLVSLLFLSLVGPARAATVDVLTPIILPGQAFIASFDELPTKTTLNGSALTAFPYKTSWRVVTSIPLSAKIGTQKFTADFKSGTVTKTVIIAARRQPIVELPVPPKLNQTPAQLVKNLATTNTGMASAIKTVTDATRFSAPFSLPLADNRRMGSPYGEIRKTGAERITHLGVDFTMPKGSVVAAINDGVITKAYLDPVYGNSVYVDHGRGIYSLYLHLDTMRVKVGDAVKKGKVVGTLGETGLASGPHLHLSIKINGVSVDPLAFVARFR